VARECRSVWAGEDRRQRFDNPTGVAVAPNGSVYIADAGNSRVVEVPWDRSTEHMDRRPPQASIC
jgi:sugar lactone lactonase YvrE